MIFDSNNVKGKVSAKETINALVCRTLAQLAQAQLTQKNCKTQLAQINHDRLKEPSTMLENYYSRRMVWTTSTRSSVCLDRQHSR